MAVVCYLFLLLTVHLSSVMSENMAAAKMAADDRAARHVIKQRIKPEIYTTIDGKTIVEDELLSFLSVKLKTVPQDDIILMAVNHFGSEWIENSKKVLFELCPGTGQRCVAYKGQLKDVNNVKSCLKLLNEVGENVPRFVSYHLDDLPSVTFNSLDVSCLVSKIDRLSVELASMKNTVSKQSTECENLHGITTDISKRLSVIEEPSASKGIAATTMASEEVQLHGPSHREPAPAPSALSVIEETAGGGIEVAMSPAWSRVLKHGKSKQRSGKRFIAAVQNKTSMNPPREKKTYGIVGTGAVENIHAVTTKRVSVFVTKLAPDLDSETLASYLKEQLSRDVTCQKIGTEYTRYSSFKVTAECKEVAEMYAPQLWPEGTYVRRFYENRKPRAAVGAGIKAPLDTEMSAPEPGAFHAC